MAQAITGGRAVLLSTDRASRRALRSVGKVAATVSDVIHFDPEPVPGGRVSEVLAHELTHVAHPSPKPRFFDDIDDSPEERKAEQVAQAMVRSPLNPSASILTPPAIGTASPAQRSAIRRRPISSLQPSSPPVIDDAGTISASALAARLSATTASTTSPIQRRARPTAAEPAAAPPAAAPPAAAPTATAPATSPQSADAFGGMTPDEWFREQLRNNFGHIMHMIEDRMIEELERRGGRLWRGL